MAVDGEHVLVLVRVPDPHVTEQEDTTHCPQTPSTINNSSYHKQGMKRSAVVFL